MARNVNTTITPKITLHINVLKADGSVVEREINIEDMVTNLRYAANGKNNRVTGRVSDIGIKIARTKRLYSSVAKARSWFSVDVTPITISVDASTEFHSDVHVIDVKELLEDDGVTDVKMIKSYLSYGFHAEILRSDDTINVFDVNEGDILSDIRYLFRGDETVLTSAKLIAIKRDGTTLKPVSLVLNLDNKLRTITVDQLVSIGSANQPIDDTQTIMGEIDPSVTELQTLFVGAGTFGDPIEVSNNVSIRGNKVGIWGTSKNRDHDTFVDETIISGPISVKDGGSLEIDGCVLTKSALMAIASGVDSLIIRNCIIKDIDVLSMRTNYLYGFSTTEPTKVVIENCYFGDNPSTETSRMYNMFELNFPLRDGSSISGNYFTKDSYSHNGINLYNVVDDATVEINDNEFEYSASAIRLGIKGDVHCTINIKNLVYDSTDESDDGKWAGMMIVQPYMKETLTMENVRVNIINAKHKDTLQLYFLYSSPSTGLLLTEENAPHVYVNGKEYPRLFNHIVNTSTPPSPPQVTVDKNALISLISDASAKLSQTEIEYTDESKAALENAIKSAQTIVDSTTASQEEVNSQVISLQNTINQLVVKEPGVEPPTQTVVDKVNLVSLINSANEKLTQTDITYTDETKDVLADAIKTAQDVVNNTEATQEDIDAQVNALQAAIDQLVEKEVEVPPPVVDKSALILLIEIANEKLTQTEIEYTQESKASLSDAIESAQTVVDDNEYTQDDVNTALEILQIAIDGLEETPVVVEVDKSSLLSLIDTANAKLTQTTIEYTEETKTVLQNAINDAQTVIDNADATQKDIDEQITVLQAAINQLVQKRPSIGEGEDEW